MSAEDRLRRRSIGLAAAGMLGAAAAVAQPVQPPPEPHFQVTGFAVEGDNPLPEAETGTLLAPYTGAQVGLAGLQAAADALEQALRKRGYTFHRVTLPPQESAGVIRLRVVAFALDRIEVKGNRHFPTENILASLPALEPGKAPNSQRLARDLALAREHPAKQLEIVMQESDKPDHVNAVVEVRDLAPLQAFASLSNTGSHPTGWWRASVGGQHSNLFGRDHALTLSYTTSPEHWNDVRQYGAHYRIPFYGVGGSLGLTASYSNVDSGTIGDFFDVSGSGRFYGAAWTQHLPPMAEYGHRLIVSLEDRYFDNNASFSGAPVATDVRSRPLAARYEGKWESLSGTTGFNVEVAHNLGGGSDNNPDAYSAARPGAFHPWTAIRWGADSLYQSPANWILSTRVRAQYSSRPLIAGEQFGLGGASSIRGFDEREVSGERGAQINLEWLSPPLVDTLRAAAFVDAGRVLVLNPQPPQAGFAALGSLGAGLRWRWRDHLNVTLDAAYVYRTAGDVPSTQEGDGKLHLSVFYRF